MFNKEKPKKYTQAMVFGVFDLFHKGHEYFLEEASKRCSKLIVVVTQKETVEILKKRTPKDSFGDRVAKIKLHNSEYIVVGGDLILGEWSVLKDNSFDIIFLGYDQQGIARELDKMGISYEFLEAHHPEIYKSSLMLGN